LEKFGEDSLKLDGMPNVTQFDEVLRKLDPHFASDDVRTELTLFLLKAHDPNRPEVQDLPSHPWVVLKDIMHPNKIVDVAGQRFYRGFVVMAGRGKQLHEMTREEEDDFLAREGIACFLPMINEQIYAIVHGLPLISTMPKPDLPRAPVPLGAVRITVEQSAPGYHWSDTDSAGVLAFQAFVQAGYRDVTHRSASFPSRNYHDTLANPVEHIRALENSDRQARAAGTLQHALRSRPIIIDVLPNLDEDGIPKTTLTYKNGRQVGFGSGPYWSRNNPRWERVNLV
jgi:hypothetical protein